MTHAAPAKLPEMRIFAARGPLGYDILDDAFGNDVAQKRDIISAVLGSLDRDPHCLGSETLCA